MLLSSLCQIEIYRTLQKAFMIFWSWSWKKVTLTIELEWRKEKTPTNGENAHEMCAFYIYVCQSQCGWNIIKYGWAGDSERDEKRVTSNHHKFICFLDNISIYINIKKKFEELHKWTIYQNERLQSALDTSNHWHISIFYECVRALK